VTNEGGVSNYASEMFA